MGIGNEFSRYDRAVAQQLLDAHEQGMTTRRALYWNIKRYVLSITPILPALFLLYNHSRQDAFASVVIILAWLVFQEFVSLRGEQRSWQLMDKVMDWEKIRLIAGKEATSSLDC